MLRSSVISLCILPLVLCAGYPADVKPFEIRDEFRFHFPADVKDGRPGHLTFYKYRVNGRIPFWGTKEHALALGVGGTVSRINWSANTLFSQDTFGRAEVGVGGMIRDWKPWDWRGSLSIGIDAANGTVGSNSRYRALLWGRYKYSDQLGFHIGALGQFGLRRDSLLPIIGVDWKPSDDWEIDAVFPIKMRVRYIIDEQWSVFARPSFHRERYRLGRTEVMSRGIIEYRSYGGEVGARYVHSEAWRVEAFVGGTGWSKLKIMDAAGRNPTWIRSNATAVAGAGGVLRF